MKDPADGMFPFQLLAERPPICNLCHMPSVYPTIEATTTRTAGYNGELYVFCSQACEFIFFEDPERYLGAVPFDVLWDGVGVDEFIIKNELLRADGKTLLAQPHCDPDLPMWTIDDIARTGFAIADPLKEQKAAYRKAYANGEVQ
jgi:YHS domain-containing protein